jgi:hypothetical protein
MPQLTSSCLGSLPGALKVVKAAFDGARRQQGESLAAVEGLRTGSWLQKEPELSALGIGWASSALWGVQVCLSGGAEGDAHEGHTGEAGRAQQLQADRGATGRQADAARCQCHAGQRSHPWATYKPA